MTAADPDQLTVNVLGTCRENVVIRGLDRLVLAAQQGASIEDASGGQQPVVEIADSRRVEIRDFRIVGGAIGVTCFNGSLCRFVGNTIEESTDYGVWTAGSQATFQGDTIQDVGIAALSFDASTVDAWDLTVQRNGHGIFVSNGSVLTGSGLAVSDSYGDPIGVDTQSLLVLSNSSVSGDGRVGVNLNNQSQALLGGQNNITGTGSSALVARVDRLGEDRATLFSRPRDWAQVLVAHQVPGRFAPADRIDSSSWIRLAGVAAHPSSWTRRKRLIRRTHRQHASCSMDGTAIAVLSIGDLLS